MLLAQLVVGPDDAALEQAPRALDGLRVNLTPDPLLVPMVDAGVWRVGVPNAPVGGPLVGVDGLGVVCDVRLDEPVERLPVGSLLDLQPDLAGAGDSAKHHRLVATVAAAHAAHLAADVGLVHLDNAAEPRLVELRHREADAVREIPRRLVTDADHAFELVCADPLFGVHNEIGRHEPLPERELGVLHDRPRESRELVGARETIKGGAALDARDLVELAARALDAIRPAQILKRVAASVLGMKLSNELREVHTCGY